MTSTPALNPRIIGQAENAHLPVLAGILRPTGTTRNQWVALSLAMAGGKAVNRNDLAGQVTDALKVEDPAAQTAISELIAGGVLAELPGDGDRVTVTTSGQARHHEIRAAVDATISRVYGDIPAEDLVTAGRVLKLITARLNADTGGAPPITPPIPAEHQRGDGLRRVSRGPVADLLSSHQDGGATFR